MKYTFFPTAGLRLPILVCLIFGVLTMAPVAGQTEPSPTPAQSMTLPAWQPLGGPKFQNWTGLQLLKSGGNTPLAGAAALDLPGEAVFRVPDGPRGWYSAGLMAENDGTIDARPWHGLRFDVLLASGTPLDLDLTARIPTQPGRHNLLDSSTARVQVQGKGWHTLTVPFESFDYNRGQVYFLKFLKQLTIKGRSQGAAARSRILLRDVRLVRGNILHLDSAIRSAPGGPDDTVTYSVKVTNCSDAPQMIALSIQRSGWEGMAASVLPAAMALRPGQSGFATVRVSVPDRLPGGARETQTLVATPQGSDESQTMEFITLRRLPSPYLLFTQDGWDGVRAKVARYDWAKKDFADIVARADAFQVPVVPPGGIPDSQDTPALFRTYIENDLWPCAVAWKLTGDRKYGEKAALFLHRLSDPQTGYPKTRHAAAGGIPQQGGFFEVMARSYDLLRDSGLLTEVDRQQIEQTFRLYIASVEDGMGDGGISNWSVFNLSPAAQCALALQDMDQFNYLMNGPTGLVDQLRYGTMDDGWWYEMALAYNLGVAEAFTNLGLAARPFGIDLLHAEYPVALTQSVGLRPFEYENFEGMAFGKFGPVRDNTVSIKKMWDGIVIYPDYRGVMFGMGDGHEEQVSGGRFEEAYYAYRDLSYATIIKQGNRRDLLFGVPDLPADTPKTYTVSGHSDDAGIAVLRSQTVNRPPSEQIQASFKYGTHGSYHGHFDRLSLNSLERDGRSFYNPETSWYGYGSYMYKWWVQPSLSHNMVVVDGKMQEPKECLPLLFHSGAMMQAVAAETDARWSNPPYFGGYDQIAGVQQGDVDYVPIPKDHPKPGDVTGYTEPVRQRRLVLVTDDYVVLADDLQGRQEHGFDNLLHLRGAGLADLEKARFLGHSAQFDPNPLSSGQFITNVDRYAVTTPVLIHSVHRIGGSITTGNGLAGRDDGRNWETGGAKSRSEPGVLQIDEHVLWPPEAEIALGDYPEAWGGVHKKLTYEVQGDGRMLASGAFGAWNLGSGAVNVDVTGLKTLQLSTRVARRQATANGAAGPPATIFWGNPILVTTEGREIPLSQLTVASANVIADPHASRDYAGGPVRIAGLPYTQSVSAEPQDAAQAARLTVDLTGLHAVRFRATVGSDWPVGDEEQLRKVVSVHTTGKQAQFLTLIEPYEARALVKSATAAGPERLRVELADGRIQEIAIRGLDSPGSDVVVTLTESKGGKVIRTETTSNSLAARDINTQPDPAKKKLKPAVPAPK